jgi:glutamate racemase
VEGLAEDFASHLFLEVADMDLLKQVGTTDTARRPIGVFDSGIGGLTVAAALRDLLPGEEIFYVGDTARVPYGGKSAATIERYSLEISRILISEGAKLIVVACNTASALALATLEAQLEVPLVGVILPGAAAAVSATRTKRVGVIGTRATVASGAYERAIQSLDPTVRVHAMACPLLVPLIEEGWLEDAVTNSVISRYLDPMLENGVDTLVLGCTHYPLLHEAIQRQVGSGVRLVDSARNCAMQVKSVLDAADLSACRKETAGMQVVLTDHSTGFLRVAERALGLELGEVSVRVPS